MSSRFKQLKVLSPSKAWAYAAVNQLAFPGAGTVMAGRRVGYVQATIMLVGFVLTMIYLCGLIFATFNAAMSSATGVPGDLQSGSVYSHQAWAGKIGFILSTLAWCWSLLSSIVIICKAQKEPPVLSW